MSKRMNDAKRDSERLKGPVIAVNGGWERERTRHLGFFFFFFFLKRVAGRIARVVRHPAQQKH